MKTASTTDSFTAVGDPTVEQTISNTLRQLEDDIRQLAGSDRVAVYLGGGYGRGEGGVFITEDNRRLPYNDLDFFVFSRKLSRAKREAFNVKLEKIGASYSKTLGISVDFAPVKPIEKLIKEQHTLMYQELLHCHRLVHGPDLLARLESSPAHDLQALEALRLMVNRGMGLLFTAQRLSAQPDKPENIDFACRNLHKAALGAGDALLIAQHRYDYALERRLKIILYDAATNSIFKELAPLYQNARDFKVLPGSSKMNPLDQYPAYLHAWLDAARHFVALTTDRSAAVLETTQQLSDCLYSHPLFTGRSPLKNAIRWAVKTRKITPLNLLFKNPTVRLFSLLHKTLHDIQHNIDNSSSLQQAIEMPDVPSTELVRLWEIFN